VEREKGAIPIDELKDTVGKWDKGTTFVAVWAQLNDPFVYRHHGVVLKRLNDGTFSVKYDEIPHPVKIPPPPSHHVDYLSLDPVDIKVKIVNPKSVAKAVEERETAQRLMRENEPNKDDTYDNDHMSIPIETPSDAAAFVNHVRSVIGPA